MIIDTGPLIAALDQRDSYHELAVRILQAARSEAMVSDPVIIEVDILARRWLGPSAGRAFLETLRSGRHTRVALAEGLLRRAIANDRQYATPISGWLTCP